MMIPLAYRAGMLGAVLHLGLLFGTVASLTSPALAASAAERRATFDIAAGPALQAFKTFGQQAGVEVLYAADLVLGVRTNAVKGEFTPREAMDRLLAGTALSAQQGSNGAIAIRKGAADPNAPRAALPVSDRPENLALASDGTVLLSPFSVSSERDTGYAASSSLAGSRVRTELRDLASPISVLTKDFLEDIGAVNLQEAIGFAPGAENNFQSADPANGNADGDLRNPNLNRIRGLGAANATRNFFPTNLRLDTYNSTRFDLSRGPNSILFGLGSPAGIVNTTMQRAEFRDHASMETRFDSEGSHRLGLSVNRILVPQKLAIYAAGLHEEAKTWQKPTLDHQNRGYLAVQARPFASTTLNASYEDYWNYRQLTRTTLARDFVSLWIAAGRPLQTTRPTALVTNLGPGLFQNNGTFAPVFVNGSLGPVQQFYNQAFEVRGRAPHDGLTGADAFPLSLPPSVMPTDINVAGPSSYAEIEGRIFNASLEQQVGERLTFELAYNREESANTLLDLSSVGITQVMVDPNVLLANGQPNPNLGRFYIQEAPRIRANEITMDSVRLTATYALDLTRQSRWLGRHQFSGLGALDRQDTADDTVREFISSNHTWLPAAAQNNIMATQRRLVRRYYLDDPFNPKGGNVHAVITQLAMTGNQVGPDGQPVISDPLRRGHISNSRTGLETKSLAGVWQGYLWDERIVTTLGWRRDEQDVFQVGGVLGADGLFLPGAQMTKPGTPTLADSGNTSTRGVAFHPTRWLSLYYNEADSFSLSNGSVDLYNRPIPGAAGEGKDIGIGLRLLDGRVQLRATRFETSQIGTLSANYRSAVRFNFDNIEDAVASYAGTARDPNLAPAEAWVQQDTVSKGYELEAVVNPTKQWRVAFNASKQEAMQSNIALQARDYLSQRLAVWQPYFDRTLIGSATTIRQTYETGIKPVLDLAAASDGIVAPKLAKWRWNLVTNYDFARDGRLKGFSVGGAVRWVDSPVVGYRQKLAGAQVLPDVTQPHFGAETFLVDGYVRYGRRFFGSFPVRLQLHVRNLLDEDELVPVRMRSDRSGGVYQALAPRLFVFSATISY